MVVEVGVGVLRRQESFYRRRALHSKPKCWGDQLPYAHMEASEILGQ